MSTVYNIDVRRGTGAPNNVKFPIEISPRTIEETSTSLSLLGHSVRNYGQSVAQNILNSLENFASNIPPRSPVLGQLWFKIVDPNDLRTHRLHVCVDDDQQITKPESQIRPRWARINSTVINIDNDGNVTDGSDTTDNVYVVDTNGQAWVVVIGGVPVAAWSKTNFTVASNVLIPLTSGILLKNVWPTLSKGLNMANTFLMHGIATSSYLSADIAERYSSEFALEPGTLVSLCQNGDYEIEKTSKFMDTEFFGVVSTNPAIKLNDLAGNNQTHPLIALVGRIPVKVIGKVVRGQRLIPSDIPGVAIGYDGKAIAHDNKNIDNLNFCIVGRALESKNTEDIGLVECAVGKK